MARRFRLLGIYVLGVCIAFAACHPTPALASDPLPGDSVAPPLNSNLFMLYDEYQNDNRYGGQPGDPHGPDATKDVRLTGNIIVARYVHDFSLAGYNSGVQVYVPWVDYLGRQRIGINDLGSAAPGVLPSLGRGHIDLTRTTGFAQPNFGFFIFPVANRKTGTYFMIGPWIAPPWSSYNKDNNLNANWNLWTFEMEFSYRTVLFGRPDTRNVALVLWEENYFYANNTDSADPGLTVSADEIPGIYHLLGASNPIRATGAVPATLRMQPTTEFRAYLPFTILPATRFYVAPGFFQSFGGKQTYRLDDGGIVDSGNRTNESQLRLVVSSFISPTLQLLMAADYDVAAHGTAYQRTLEFRLLKEF